MRYFVIGPDGSKYGPGDLTMLNSWIAEHRIIPTTILEEELTGKRIAAGDVIGLVFGPQGHQSQPTISQGTIDQSAPTTSAPQYASKPDIDAQLSGSYRTTAGDGSSELVWAWVLFALGCCCFLFSIFGLVLAIRSKDKGNPGAMAAIIANSVMIALALFGNGIFYAGIFS